MTREERLHERADDLYSIASELVVCDVDPHYYSKRLRKIARHAGRLLQYIDEGTVLPE